MNKLTLLGMCTFAATGMVRAEVADTNTVKNLLPTDFPYVSLQETPLDKVPLSRFAPIRQLFPADYPYRPFRKKPTDETFSSKFATEFSKPDTFVNHLGSPSMFQWVNMYEQGTQDPIQAFDDAGRRSFEDAASYGLREAVASYIPTEDYELRAKHIESRVKHIGISFVHGIIGNTAEEQRSLVSAIPNASEYSWLKQARADGLYDYGMRPFNSSPYLYGYTRVGHYVGQPFATISGRWYYDLKHNKEHMAIESIFSMPLNYGFQVGTSFDPFNANDSERTSFSFRLQHFKYDSVFKSWSVGLQQNGHTTLVAQLDWTW